MIHPSSKTQRRYRSWIVNCSLVISVTLSLLFISIQAASGMVNQSVENQPSRKLELGKPIERELIGGQHHSYQMTLDANQYVSIVVDQRGIDVAVKLFGPDGKQIAAIDSEIRSHGSETVSWVAEELGSYRLDVVMKPMFAAGRYEIKVEELRTATDNDRALYESKKLYIGFLNLRQAGKFDEARPVGERVLALREKALGPDHPDVAHALNGLAILYITTGNDVEAERLFQRALTIFERALDPEHPALAQALNNLAGIYKTRGNYAKAEVLIQRALPIDIKVLGPEHPNVAREYNNLAIIYSERGDDAKAESLSKRALTIWEKALGPEHPTLAQALNNLALIYQTRGDYTQSESLFQRLLAILEKAVGPEHPFLAQYLVNLANLLKDKGDYAKAEQLYERALTIRKKALGPTHFLVSQVLGNFAVLYRMRGEYEKAERLNEFALSSVDSALGPDHPYTAEVLNEIAKLYAAKDDIGHAIATLSRANAVEELNFALILASGSERQKLAYLDLYSKATNFTLSLQSEFAPNDPQVLNLAFTTLLRRKTRGLDAMADTIATIRRHATPQDLELFDKLKDARSQLAALALNAPGNFKPDDYRKDLDSLKEKVDNLEAELSSRNDEFGKYRKDNQPTTLSAIQSALPPHTALVEFAYFTPLDPKTDKYEPPRYLAYLLAPQGQPNWVDLGEAAAIDQAINAWRNTLRNPNSTDVKRTARALDEMLMRPVRELLSDMPGNPSNLLISPDGSLNLIPFAALVDEQNKFLVERYSITYLTSGRDLLRLQTTDQSKGEPLVVANPDFGRFATIAMRGSRTSGKSDQEQMQFDPTKLFFTPLPSTEDEALAIRAILPKASLLQQEEATETALKKASGPKILHIATHGFFLDYQEPALKENSSPVLASRKSPYTIQFEASPVLETAQEKVKGLKAQGIDAYIVKSEVKGKGTYFRVRAGNFRTQTEALKYGADLRGKGAVNEFFIARYEPPQIDSTQQLASLRLSRNATKIKDPLLRSGLALAGANQGKSGDDDGVLTALEASYLDLTGTKLVVLSACDTGVGEVRNGEGVQGLRRALVLAGSEAQVMSLWPVADEATKDLMVPYYKALQQGEGRSAGLRQVQLRMIHGRKERRHPFYWAAFIQSGEWANLDGQR
jgi:CHAT domain-containing protein/Flp pilus assembly protein TadD